MIDPDSLECVEKDPPSIYDRICYCYIYARETLLSLLKKIGGWL